MTEDDKLHEKNKSFHYFQRYLTRTNEQTKLLSKFSLVLINLFCPTSICLSHIELATYCGNHIKNKPFKDNRLAIQQKSTERSCHFHLRIWKTSLIEVFNIFVQVENLSMTSVLPVLFSVLCNSSIFINVNVSTCLYIWWAPCQLQLGTLIQILLFLPPETSGHSLSRFPPTKAKALSSKPPAVGPQSWMYLSLALLKMLWTKVFLFLSKSLFCSPTLPLQNFNPLSHAITILSSGLQFLLGTQTTWNPQQPKSQLYSNILCNVIVQKQWLKLLLFRVGQWETISEGERAFSYDPPDLLFFPLFFFHHSP